MIWAALGILAIILVVTIFKVTQGNQDKAKLSKPIEDLSSLTVADARRGDTLVITGAGDGYEDLSLTIDKVNRYESGSDHWFEMTGRYRGKLVFVEVYEDDELEVQLNRSEFELSLQDLGLDDQALADMDENRDYEAGFDFDSSRWQFAGSKEAVCYGDGDSKGEGFYGWEFREVGGDRVVFVEKYEGEPFEVGMATKINPDDIKVFRA